MVARQAPLVGRGQLDLERGDDLRRQLVLDAKDVGEPAVVTLGPQGAPVMAVDQTDIQPQLVALTAQIAPQ